MPPKKREKKMGSPMTMKRPCFIEDDGLASVAVMEAGFSGNITNTNNNNINTTQNYYYCHQNQQSFGHNGAPVMMMRRNSLRNVSSLGSSSSVGGAVCSPRSGRLFYDARFEEPSSPHFLEACFLCKKPLGDNRDIFMYRGDTPFCSEECRQEQIEIDEAKEKNRNLKALRSKKETSKSTSSSSSSATSPEQNQNYPFRTGTVAAA